MVRLFVCGCKRSRRVNARLKRGAQRGRRNRSASPSLRIQDTNPALARVARRVDQMAPIREPRRLHAVERRLGNTSTRASIQVHDPDLKVAPVAHGECNLVGISAAPVWLRAVSAHPTRHTHRRTTTHRHDVQLRTRLTCINQPRSIRRKTWRRFYGVRTRPA